MRYIAVHTGAWYIAVMYTMYIAYWGMVYMLYTYTCPSILGHIAVHILPILGHGILYTVYWGMVYCMCIQYIILGHGILLGA